MLCGSTQTCVHQLMQVNEPHETAVFMTDDDLGHPFRLEKVECGGCRGVRGEILGSFIEQGRSRQIRPFCGRPVQGAAEVAVGDDAEQGAIRLATLEDGHGTDPSGGQCGQHILERGVWSEVGVLMFIEEVAKPQQEATAQASAWMKAGKIFTTKITHSAGDKCNCVPVGQHCRCTGAWSKT